MCHVHHLQLLVTSSLFFFFFSRFSVASLFGSSFSSHNGARVWVCEYLREHLPIHRRACLPPPDFVTVLRPCSLLGSRPIDLFLTRLSIVHPYIRSVSMVCLSAVFQSHWSRFLFFFFFRIVSSFKTIRSWHDAEETTFLFLLYVSLSLHTSIPPSCHFWCGYEAVKARHERFSLYVCFPVCVLEHLYSVKRRETVVLLYYYYYYYYFYFCYYCYYCFRLRFDVTLARLQVHNTVMWTSDTISCVQPCKERRTHLKTPSFFLAYSPPSFSPSPSTLAAEHELCNTDSKSALVR